MAKAQQSVLAEAVEQQKFLEAVARTVKEAADDRDSDWQQVAGPAPVSYTGGLLVRRTAFARLRDREDGRFLPFYDNERDLDQMRAKMRALAAYTSVAVGAMQSLRVYCMGGEWEYEVVARDGVDPPAGLIEECQKIIDEILERNAFVGELDHEIHDSTREDGESPIACYATTDGLIDIRRLDADNIRAPGDPKKLNQWLEVDDAQVSWTFGVATLFDERMRRIDHEQPAGYHVIFNDDGSSWDYMPAWPRNVGDPDLDGKFCHLIKWNVPRRAKRGISDYWPVLLDLEREDKLNTNLSVGAAVLAAIAWIEEMPTNATREQVAAQLNDALTNIGRSLTTARGGERTVAQMRPGTVVKVSNGRKYESGPLGQPRSQIWVEVAAAIKRRIAARWNMPEYMISADASNANFASTLVAESPFVKGREAEQKKFVSNFRSIFMKALKIAADHGRFANFGVDWRALVQIIRLNIQPPKVASRDKAQQLNELNALWEKGLIDGNEFRVDLGREAKPELEGKTVEPPAPPLGGPGASVGPDGQPMPGIDQLAASMRQAGRSSLQAAVESGLRRVETIQEAKALLRSAIFEAKADCGANAPGGGGFQSGNECAGEGGGGASAGTGAGKKKAADSSGVVKGAKVGAYLAEHQGGGEKTKTATEKKALKTYVIGGYKKINSALREGKSTPEVKHLDAILARAKPLTKSIEVMRGVRNPESFLGQLKAGSVFEDRGYMSTGTKAAVAKHYSAAAIGGGAQTGSAILKIKVPAGAKGLYFKGHDEFTLPRGTKLKVNSISGGKSKTIEAEVVL